MRKAKTNLAILFIALISLISTSCMHTSDNFKVRDLVSYINTNKVGEEKFKYANVYEDYAQKSIVIDFVNVHTLSEADEIIRLINQYLSDNPDYFLNDDYYIEVRMDAVGNSYTRNFVCRNSMEIILFGEEDSQDILVDVEKNLCHLVVYGIVLDTPSRKISSFNGLFSDIKSLRLSDSVIIDDLSVFGTFHNLQSVSMDIAGVGVSDDTLTQLRKMYPEIIFS